MSLCYELLQKQQYDLVIHELLHLYIIQQYNLGTPDKSRSALTTTQSDQILLMHARYVKKLLISL